MSESITDSHTTDPNTTASKMNGINGDININIYNPEATVHSGTILQSINNTNNNHIQHMNGNDRTSNNNIINNKPDSIQHARSLPMYSSFQSTTQPSHNNHINNTVNDINTPISQTRNVQSQQLRSAYSVDGSGINTRVSDNQNLSNNKLFAKQQQQLNKQQKIKRKYKTKHRKINKTHPEFELTYDMMLGIRTTVGQSESHHALHSHHDTELSESSEEEEDSTTKYSIFHKQPKTTNLNKKFQEQISLRFPGRLMSLPMYCIILF